ncbi:transcriptional regulator, TrmB [Sulfolobus islandicus Y.N.15.51]|uniref:Transcriptional regulator, TrmB n=4 Tax=Saccharolobus islandicus TaxID=43080 RepID=C3MVQ4_SACI4|nr:TrmB family transcriptional regulator [Sulfolobus islandicus]ACP37491.1 transcriptional regulator, TrmB [Sulfolobus islandicus M.14.25]ACP49337.1 transcriptional regulator, TrmB [Sulfolobus islandicus Y.N.15.51]ADB86400.1 transcriptional regulator TrmB [Sulfolobus islandicus L.D.8.5]ADX81968.1 transcriptional regulator, TrmB [Sulfolobus islandicus HVE10/4]WCM36689.1 TrmB family transcriptional regulator [Sulfolobus islandicus]
MDSELEINLRKLGFSVYEAKVYLTLLNLCNSTMKELSEKAQIPYQKVYEVVKSLEDKGLVRVIEGRPKKVKLIDPSMSLKVYRDKIVSELDYAIGNIISFWNEKRKGEADRSLHIKGKKTVIRMIRELTEKSNKMKVVWDNLPEWLIKTLKKYKGSLTLITSSNNLNLNGDIRYVKDMKSKFIIFDDSVLVTFNNEYEIVVDSCRGCVLQAEEHFELLTYKSE